MISHLEYNYCFLLGLLCKVTAVNIRVEAAAEVAEMKCVRNLNTKKIWTLFRVVG
jgi:hypothetical protein